MANKLYNKINTIIMKKIIYVFPNSEWDEGIEYDDILDMYNNGELLNFANNCNFCNVYDDIESFALDFNNDFISDFGYMFVIND